MSCALLYSMILKCKSCKIVRQSSFVASSTKCRALTLDASSSTTSGLTDNSIGSRYLKGSSHFQKRSSHLSHLRLRAFPPSLKKVLPLRPQQPDYLDLLPALVKTLLRQLHSSFFPTSFDNLVLPLSFSASLGQALPVSSRISSKSLPFEPG